jgi:CheY-like chemotaxis protein/anti-sigma regulatory factor (Ser/Thr protein kinase)
MPTILIVDDDPVDRALARACLEPFRDLRIMEATDGRKALEVLAGGSPDLIVTDLRMPGMDGLELVGKLQETYPFLPIILMTAFGSEELAVRALAAGAASYVPKRDMSRNLLQTAEQVIEVAQARRQRHRVFQYMSQWETSFALENDPDLIYPLIGFFQDHLESLGFGDDALRTHVGMALMEALTNAMYHGNLEVSSALRRDSQEEFFRLAEQRRREEPYAGRRIHITAKESRERIAYVIRDEGPGFDPGTLPDPTDPTNLSRLSGRGLLLIRTFMDTVTYNATGNEIALVKHAPQSA